MTYRGHLRAVILDWAGTVVDYGSRAPVHAFIETFRRAGVEITTAEARAPMGSAKRDHIAAILAIPEVTTRWRDKTGAEPTDADTDRLYADFIPIQVEVIADFADLIPGTVEALATFRESGLKVGSTTGYSREMMDVLAPAAAKDGFEPDAIVAADDVPAGRPAPWMCFENMLRLGVYPPSAVVKIGDTIPDVEEGLNAGMWTIAVAATGNELGLSPEEAAAVSGDEFRSRVESVAKRFTTAGAHYAVSSIADVPPILQAIEHHLSVGDAP
jgi:phosphonoacetaldehyde hydrolase